MDSGRLLELSHQKPGDCCIRIEGGLKELNGVVYFGERIRHSLLPWIRWVLMRDKEKTHENFQVYACLCERLWGVW